MAHQSPMISIPKKSTEEVDWTTPIRNLIAQSYGENPDNYAAECATLQRCRQDAVKGAGSDFTARDLLYKYFGQLELLELRFSEIKVTFPWHDAFTNKLITQTSIAYEKASILFQIAATHSAIASSQSRSDPEGLKRAFYYFRTCAGMLHYINENFLHAPSTDLSRDVVKFLSSVILAQATEVFFEKCTDEKKGNALVSKVGAQAASMYATLCEEVKEFMGKGIFDRNWITLLQIKAKYFSSLSQYYRGLADNAAGKHGDALVRFTLADNYAKEASRTASSFGSSFVPSMSPNLPADAGPSIQERTKAHSVLCTERKNEGQRENDLIYNAILPSPEALPVIEKTVVATPVHIHDVYGAPDVQKTIGQDFFIRLVPLSVHESASVYSEEKAKLVRAEVEKAESAEGEARSALDVMGVKEGLMRYKAMAEGSVGNADEVPMEVRRWKEDITLVEDREGVDGMLTELHRLKESVQQELDSVSRALEIESRDCEEQRVKREHKWTQEPSAGPSKSLRQDLKSHFGALEAAAKSDQQVVSLWESVRGDIKVLLSPEVEQLFIEHAGSSGEHLLDLDVGSEVDDAQERAKIGGFVEEIEEHLGRLNKIAKERNETLKDLKEKIQTDDVSHLLLLNRRNAGVEPTLFAAELEKFRPYQQRLAATVQHQEAALKNVASLWKGLKEHAGRGPGARKWEEREKKKKDVVRRFSNARDIYMEVRDGLAKGLQFYTELTDLTKKLQANTRNFVSARVAERDALIAKIDKEDKLSAVPPPLAAKPPLPPPPPASTAPSLDKAFASMNLRGGPTAPQQWQQNPSPPISSQSYGNITPIAQYPPPPPRPPPQSQQLYGNGSPAQYSASPPHSGTPPAPQQQQQSSPSMLGFIPPPPARPVQSSFSPSSASPQTDPYASLGMFASPVSHAGQNQSTAKASLPLPPSQQPQNSFIPQQHYPSGYLPSQTSLTQQTPYQTPQQQQQLHRMSMTQQQQPQQFGFHPPPTQVNYSYGPAPVPRQQNHQQQQRNSLHGFPTHQPPSGGGYGRGY